MSPNAFKPEAETAAAATTTLARAAILVLVALSKAGRGAKELGAPGGSVYFRFQYFVIFVIQILQTTNTMISEYFDGLF